MFVKVSGVTSNIHIFSRMPLHYQPIYFVLDPLSLANRYPPVRNTIYLYNDLGVHGSRNGVTLGKNAQHSTDNRPKSAHPISANTRTTRLRTMSTEVTRENAQEGCTYATNGSLLRPPFPASTLLFNYRDRLSCTFEWLTHSLWHRTQTHAHTQCAKHLHTNTYTTRRTGLGPWIISSEIYGHRGRWILLRMAALRTGCKYRLAGM